MPPPRQRAERFTYDGFAIDPSTGEIACSYSTEGHRFTERFTFGPSSRLDDPAVAAAARLLFLLAGVSYYKTTAASVIDLGTTATTADERDFLAHFYVHGLGEFAYRNELDLSDLEIVGPERASNDDRALRTNPRAPAHSLRRRDRFDRHGGGSTRAHRRRRAVHCPSPRPTLRRHRRRRGGDHAPGHLDRPRDRPLGPSFRRARILQRTRPDHRGDFRRSHRCSGARPARRRRVVERTFRLGTDTDS